MSARSHTALRIAAIAWIAVVALMPGATRSGAEAAKVEPKAAVAPSAAPHTASRTIVQATDGEALARR